MTEHVEGALSCCTCTGHLEIAGVSMHTPAWCVLDLAELWMPPNVRGSNLIVPGVAGQRPYPLFKDQTDYSLPMMISGALDFMGNPPSPHGVVFQLYKNVKYLRSFFDPDGVTATHPATIDMADGSELTADVQVLGIRVGWHKTELTRCTLELRVPAGAFA